MNLRFGARSVPGGTRSAPSRFVVGGAVSVVALSVAPPSLGQCEQWLFGPGQETPGPDGSVIALTLWDPDGTGPLPLSLVAAGDFVGAGATMAQRIAAWDGAEWSALGGGITGGQVLALAVYNGEVVAAGTFTHAGGTAVNRIARWNGSAWLALGAGLDARVNALGVHDGRLYAGGVFMQAGGGPAARIASWNGSVWQPVGPGFTGASDEVHALASYAGALYAGGSFSPPGGVPNAGVFVLSGGAWSAPAQGVNGPVHALATWTPFVGDPVLYVGGAFTAAGGAPAQAVARYTAATGQWTALSAPTGSVCTNVFPRAITLNSHEPYALYGPSIGAKRVHRHASGVWNLVGDHGAFCLGSYGGVVAGGSAGLDRWDGQAWAPLGRGLRGPARATVSDGANLYLGGDIAWADGQVGNIARWDGATWHPLGAGVNDTVYGLALYQGNLIAAGEFTSAGGLSANRVARWTGASWQAMPGISGARVYGLGVHDGALYCTANEGFYRWTGAAWVPAGSGAGFDAKAVASWGGALYGAAANGVQRLDGTSWTGLGGRGDAWALAPFGSRLASAHSGFGGSGVMAWDGAAWTELLPLGAVSLHAKDGQLYAGAGGNVLRYDGAAWHEMDGGVNNAVWSMTTHGGELVLAGAFNTAGGQHSRSWARWGCPPAPPCYANCDGSTVAPVLNVADFSCFLQRFAGGEAYANCDASTTPPVLNVADFSCFLQRFAAGCP